MLCHTELHSVSVASKGLMTLVLQGPHLASTTQVYARTCDQLRNPVVDDYFSAAEIARKLQSAIEWMSDAGL